MSLLEKTKEDPSGSEKNGKADLEILKLSLPPGVRLKKVDYKTGIIEGSYFNHGLKQQVDFKTGEVLQSSLDLSSISSTTNHVDEGNLLKSITTSIKRHHWETLKELLKQFLDKAGRVRFFPEQKTDQKNYKIDYKIKKGASIMGFAVGTRDQENNYILSKIALGYNFKNKKILSRVSIEGKSETFDNEDLHNAFYPIIKTVARRYRGDDPWENPWK